AKAAGEERQSQRDVRRPRVHAPQGIRRLDRRGEEARDARGEIDEDDRDAVEGKKESVRQVRGREAGMLKWKLTAAFGVAIGIAAEDTFIYIRGYPSQAERDKRLKAAHDDPEFAEVVLKQERDPNARLIIKAHNIDMAPHGPYSAIKITE